MNRTLLSIIGIFMAISASAQMYVWKGGAIAYEMKEGIADSITFVDPMAKYKFSVGNGKTVKFSPGNLQYMGGTEGELYSWRFAEHQYDFIGLSNNYARPTYEGWTDLFGWGTARGGWEDDNDKKDNAGHHPYTTSTSTNDYVVDGDYTKPLGAYDWGFLNSSPDILNGEEWRVMKTEEWNYLLINRDRATELFGLACIHELNTRYIYGLVILPDSWECPRSVNFKPIKDNTNITYDNGFYQDNESNNSYLNNVYTTEQWSVLEAAGAIFLPAAGYRHGTDTNLNSHGYYWSYEAAPDQKADGSPIDTNAHALTFDQSGIRPSGEFNRSYGSSVRLVSDIIEE